MRTDVERDVRTLANVGDLGTFTRFLRLCAGRTVYFLDTGLAAALLGVRSAANLASHPLRGALFETFVFTELVQLFLHHGEPPPQYFWRDHTGHEVDFVVDLGDRLVPIECKSGQTVGSDAFGGLDRYLALSGGTSGVLVYGGAEADARRGHAVQGWAGVS